MTVFENLVVAGAFAKGRREREVYDLSAQILDDCELDDKANVKAGELTFLDRKRLELARALATRPRSCSSTRSPAASARSNARRWSASSAAFARPAFR